MISVCIATYNGADVILTQINSILPQINATDEIVISDDGSTDCTVKILENLKDSRIRIIKGPCMGSPIPNFENALKHAKGDYIFLSDQDDKWMEGKVEAITKKFKEGYDCVMTDCVVTDESLNVTHQSFFALNKTHEGKYYNLLVKNGYIGGCMAFTRPLLERCLPFPKNLPMHDMWFGNVASFYYSMAFIHQPYSYFRRTGNNASSSGEKSKNSLWTKLMIRFKIITELLLLEKNRM